MQMLAFSLITALAASPLLADQPLVEAATAKPGSGGWSFSVTLSHPDTGWDHYADGWQVLDGNGTVLGYRRLVHPHVNEQPFTRSLAGVRIPAGSETVLIRAHCLVDGWGEARFKLALTAEN